MVGESSASKRKWGHIRGCPGNVVVSHIGSASDAREDNTSWRTELEPSLGCGAAATHWPVSPSLRVKHVWQNSGSSTNLAISGPARPFLRDGGCLGWSHARRAEPRGRAAACTDRVCYRRFFYVGFMYSLRRSNQWGEVQPREVCVVRTELTREELRKGTHVSRRRGVPQEYPVHEFTHLNEVTTLLISVGAELAESTSHTFLYRARSKELGLNLARDLSWTQLLVPVSRPPGALPPAPPPPRARSPCRSSPSCRSSSLPHQGYRGITSSPRSVRSTACPRMSMPASTSIF